MTVRAWLDNDGYNNVNINVDVKQKKQKRQRQRQRLTEKKSRLCAAAEKVRNKLLGRNRVDLLSPGRGGEETQDDHENINRPPLATAPTWSGQFQTLSTLSSLSLLSSSLPLPLPLPLPSSSSSSGRNTPAATAAAAHHHHHQHHRGPLSSPSSPRAAAQTYSISDDNNSSSSATNEWYSRRQSEQQQQQTVGTATTLPPPPLQQQVQVMDAPMVMEVIDLIGSLFDHIPYAVCGTAALIYYGYRGYRPDHVSITCPEESNEAIRCWAVAKGMSLSPSDPGGFRIRTADGRTWTVCIKFMKSGFQNLSRIRVGPFRASIVTLPSIANTIARSYVSRLHTATTDRQAVYAKYLTWTLRRIIQMAPSSDDQCLNPQRARDIISREFWIPFTLSYPDTVPLFISAGLEIIDGGPLQWQAEDQLLLSRQRSSFHSYNTMLIDEDDESENTPSLRRVTKRLPPNRPLLNPPTFSSPSYSYSDSEVSSSPNFVLASSNPTTPTRSRYSAQFHQRTSSDSQGSARRRITPRGVKPQVWI
ncbi:hypothetical protein PT974_06017 [Cladobotryum mycophilum]|uniref:Uncharacterized protein n=1 Tax=Cladobotryum mycophilum TaxID=491253 RepID=A0ABR0SKD4_9HYPO